MLMSPGGANRLYDSNADRAVWRHTRYSAYAFCLAGDCLGKLGYRGASGYLPAPLLAFFAPSLSVYDAAFIAQAHMIGWGTGTMVSYSSLSVVTVGEQFNLKTRQLSFGFTFLSASGGLAIGAGDIAGFCPWPVLPVLWLVIGEYKKPAIKTGFLYEFASIFQD